MQVSRVIAVVLYLVYCVLLVVAPMFGVEVTPVWSPEFWSGS